MAYSAVPSVEPSSTSSNSQVLSAMLLSTGRASSRKSFKRLVSLKQGTMTERSMPVESAVPISRVKGRSLMVWSSEEPLVSSLLVRNVNSDEKGRLGECLKIRTNA